MSEKQGRFNLLNMEYFIFLLLFAEASGNCLAKGDIVFLLDESGSVGYSHFETMKTFVYNIISHFSIGPNANQVSVVTFDFNAVEAFSLNTYTTLSDLQSAVQSLSYTGGGTSIGKALEFARLYSFHSSHGARPDSAKIVILITDGGSPLSNEAKLLKDQYVTIFCVGVTSGINEELLRNVSSHNDYTYITDDFITLSKIQTHIAERSCADNIDDCLGFPCQNGGTCEDQLGKYVCHCTGSTTDKNCYIPGLPNVTTGVGGTGSIGSNRTITCLIVGNYTAVFWEYQYNGVISYISLPNPSKYRGGTTSTPSLTIYNFSVSDIGNYRCSARNNVGTAHSSIMAFVDIRKSGLTITTVTPVYGVIGGSITLTCNISITYPPVASVTWDIDGSTIETSEGRYHSGTLSVPSLTIEGLQLNDQGNYTCSATNLYSSGQSSISLFVIDNIAVTTVSPVSGRIGSSVTLMCNVNTTYPPVISVTWELDGSSIDIPPGGRYYGGNVSVPSLTITNLQITDQGNYTCSATDEYSSGHAFVYLAVTISCDLCGAFEDCTEKSNGSSCQISTWKLSLSIAVLILVLLMGICLVYNLRKNSQSKRMSLSDNQGYNGGPYVDIPKWKQGVQLKIFHIFLKDAREKI